MQLYDNYITTKVQFIVDLIILTRIRIIVNLLNSSGLFAL